MGGGEPDNFRNIISFAQKSCEVGIVLIIQMRKQKGKASAPKSHQLEGVAGAEGLPHVLPLWLGYLDLPLPLPVPLANVFHLLYGQGPCLHLSVNHRHSQLVHLGRL